MSRFYASINGQAKTTAKRRGSEKSGIEGHIRGWNIGVRVDGFVNANGQDSFNVLITSGSNNNKASKYIGTFTADDLEGE